MTDIPDPTPKLAILLLAAGAASRMQGGDKLLEEVDGVPLLQRLSSHACAVCDTVLVCLREGQSAREFVLSGLKLQVIVVADAAEGMAHTMRAGIAHLSKDITGVMVVPADMPELTERDLQEMVQAHHAHPHAILRATSQSNQPGHPVTFPARLFDELQTLSGDVGARSVLKRHIAEIIDIPLPYQHALIDLDTPEDWSAWRLSQRESGS